MDFCLLNQDGQTTCLNDYRGQWVVLYFSPKDNSKSCTVEALDFTASVREFQSQDAVIIGISPDSIKSHQNFIKKHNLDLILLSDPEHEVLRQFDVWQLKKMYGREYFGVVRSTFLINSEGVIEYSWKKVRVKGHVNEVKKRNSPNFRVNNSLLLIHL